MSEPSWRGLFYFPDDRYGNYDIFELFATQTHITNTVFAISARITIKISYAFVFSSAIFDK
jgi:hypothetical protein